ncbi:MAG: ABC transporter permease subunit [Chloroflexi bacterium]|nr:ABC transporter permease subunit [Chloroflexota bacterium]
MTDLAFQRQVKTGALSDHIRRVRHWGPVALTLLVILLIGGITLGYAGAPLDAPALVNSTPGQLALWMAEQSQEDAPVSLLGQAAKRWAASLGQESLTPETILAAMRTVIVLITGVLLALLVAGMVGLSRGVLWSRRALLLALAGMDTLLFILPPDGGATELALLLFSLFLMLVILLVAPGRVTKVLGFMVVLSALLLAWEVFKAFADWASYRVVLPEQNWTYTPYPTLDEALHALENGDADAVIADTKELTPLAPSVRPDDNAPDPATLPHPNVRLLTTIDKNTSRLGLPIIPAFPGRLTVAVRADDANRWTAVSELVNQRLAAVEGSFAADKLLSQPRQWMLIDLSIGNDLNLPHLQKIAEALFQPARRNGPVLLVRILATAAQFTWTEAVLGFAAGALLGFALGTLFAHSPLMERGLLPYVVASQTIPILAIAPMVVIWLGASPISVAVISAYLTFFPVTINTLRGLKSPHPNALELMHSYAASRWTILWKLRLPAALPYIFTALKVSATASVVGAIIGELPSGIGDGLGRAILDFNQYYTSDPAKLWAAIFIAALVGIGFFVLVVLAERWLMPKRAALE